MPKFEIKFRGAYDNSKSIIIKADCKRDAMIKFNNRFRKKYFEIYAIEENIEAEEVLDEQSNIKRFKSNIIRATRKTK